MIKSKGTQICQVLSVVHDRRLLRISSVKMASILQKFLFK